MHKVIKSTQTLKGQQVKLLGNTRSNMDFVKVNKLAYLPFVFGTIFLHYSLNAITQKKIISETLMTLLVTKSKGGQMGNLRLKVKITR